MPTSIILNNESDAIRYLCKHDKRIAKVISQIGSLEYSLPEDSYVFLVSQIVNQMLSNKVAAVIFERLKLLCGGEISISSIQKLSFEEMKSTGLSKNKIQYIGCLTQAVDNGNIIFSELDRLSDEDVIQMLTQIRGIGVWSAKMYLLFKLNRQDILPYEDIAFLQAYRWLYKTDDVSQVSIEKKCKKWKPYSSIAARYLYKALDQGYTKSPFHLYK